MQTPIFRWSVLFLGLCVCLVSAMAGCATSTGPGAVHEDPATPGVGDTAPDFTLTAIDGRRAGLSKLAEDGPVVLLVLRGYPGYQCPICTRQVGDYISKAEQFKERGAKIVLVYPGPSDQLKAHAEEFVGDTALPDNFVFLLDPDYTFTNRYGLRWDEPRETAYPSTFVIGKGDRKVAHAHISHTHGDRTKADDIIKVLDGGASEPAERRRSVTDRMRLRSDRYPF